MYFIVVLYPLHTHPMYSCLLTACILHGHCCAQLLHLYVPCLQCPTYTPVPALNPLARLTPLPWSQALPCMPYALVPLPYLCAFLCLVPSLAWACTCLAFQPYTAPSLVDQILDPYLPHAVMIIIPALACCLCGLLLPLGLWTYIAYVPCAFACLPCDTPCLITTLLGFLRLPMLYLPPPIQFCCGMDLCLPTYCTFYKFGLCQPSTCRTCV